MIIDCDTCFYYRYCPELAETYICGMCKKNNNQFYRPDLSDLKGTVTVIKVSKE